MTAIAEATFGELICWEGWWNVLATAVTVIALKNSLFGSKTVSFDFSSSLLVTSCMVISSDTNVVCAAGPSASFVESPNFGSFLRRAMLFDTTCLVTL